MVQQIKKILFTSDLSEGSIEVFEQTVGLAFQTGASITMLHVIDNATSENQKRVSYLIDAETYERIRREGQEMAKNALIGKQKSLPIIQNAMRECYGKTCDKIVGSDKPIVIDSIQVMYGYPAEKILETADILDCDLIAMGYHKKGSILRALAGRAEKGVMKKSKKPLFLVPLDS
jgi:nucleotide-binding universal stress UspA family protein